MRLRPVLDAIYRSLMILSGLAMLTAFLAVIAGIADRQMAWGLRGLDAYAGYAIAAALFLALPQTLQRGEHIRVSLVLQRLSQRWRSVLEWWCLLAALALSGALAFYAVRLIGVSYTTHDVSQGSDATPLWIPQIAMALGCIGLALAFADALISRATGGVFFREADSGEAARVE